MGNYQSINNRELQSLARVLREQEMASKEANTILYRPQLVANEVFLRQIAGLKNVPDEVLIPVASMLRKRVYAAGSFIIRQYDIGDRFHFVYDGEIEYFQIVKRKGKTRKINHGIGRPGAYFGEKALTTHKLRTMSVRAVSNVTTLSMSKQDFRATLGVCCAMFNSRGLVGVDKAYSGMHKPECGSLDKKYEKDAEILERLEKECLIGKGSFGTVWSVRNVDTNVHYALKVVKKSLLRERKMLPYMIEEKLILSAAKHPFIVEFHGTFSDAQNEFILMDICSKDNLATILRRHRYFPEESARFYITGIILALRYLHEQQIIFRDLKLDNILIDMKGYARLCDFGLAKRVCGKTYTLCGTFGYLSPELFLDRGYTKACDLWSLGVCMYELVSGVKPFTSSTQNNAGHPADFARILRANKISFHKNLFSKTLKKIIKNLCCEVPSKRISLQKVLSSVWYDKFDFNSYIAKTVPPPIPACQLNLPKGVRPLNWSRHIDGLAPARRISIYVHRSRSAGSVTPCLPETKVGAF